ncbi:MAG: HAD hydrolase family protein [Bacteroidetes bacterium]|nr:HAD hydrolase family protein [Bacteroidota bacterium]
MLNFKQKLNNISTFIFDVDGVLSDGKIQVLTNGELIRSINSKDGYAIHLALQKKYKIAIISGGNNVAIKKALENMGVTDIFINQHDKLQCYKDFIYSNQISDETVLYMGDDLPDYEVMQRVGCAVCPSDAAIEIKNLCSYISSKQGGEGCVRDIIEQVLRVQGNWEIVKW